MKPALLLADMGNTSVTLGLAQAGRISRVRRLPTGSARPPEIAAALAELVRGRRVAGAVLCSVVPARTPEWLRALQDAAGAPPLVVSHRLALGLRLDYSHPASIGADRLANACGAARRYGWPVVVADFGTALTFDVVADGAYQGGLIVPGVPLMTEYLAEKTALLPRLRLDRYRGAAPAGRAGPAIGKSTRQAMAIGARLGYLGMVREIFTRLRQALPGRAPRLCATGGYAAWVLRGSGLPVRFDPHLTLYGLARIHELNGR